ncbi:MAG: hypothetical protein DCC71_23785 [Proteobacteria bacterium]|nr:MAG: hypothetical protein DCC71_23785 [Pseudomonadota bacterium]
MQGRERARRASRALLFGLVPALACAIAPTCFQQRRVEAGREPCASYQALRAPFFGETHAHTTYSFDAVLLDTRTDPRDAYAFARGGPIGLPPYDALGQPTRTAQLERPLDFAIVTDHAEYFGERNICLDPSFAGYASTNCVRFRQAIGAAPGGGVPIGFQIFGLPLTTASPSRSPAVCGSGLVDCLAQSASVWAEIQAAAEEAYDRTSACAFTSFVGYEWTANTSFSNLHRNVVFRNEIVPEPISYFEATTPEALWSGLESACREGLPGCDVLAIPHNSNIGNGFMFDASAATPEYNATRAAMEPLVEIAQHKGDSECRTGVGNTDEDCSFEKLDWTSIFAGPPDPEQTFPPENFVRNALREGVLQESLTGANPFRFGFVGGTDTHRSTPGATDEFAYQGHLGFAESNPEFRLFYPMTVPAGNVNNPGALTVLWSEENSREGLWRAMRRREAYATSGTRPVVRFFGGYQVPSDICSAPNYARAGYAAGEPMGGVLPAFYPGLTAPPRFTVLALQDPGTAAHPGTPLQRIQIVKGWTDGQGGTQEQVFEVAGDPNNGASVDTQTCTPQGAGFASLCAVWEDPGFDPAQHAFYYARVFENPTCRWSAYECRDAGITCDGATPSQEGYEACCDPAIPNVIQERAWTSPIWFTPSGA